MRALAVLLALTFGVGVAHGDTDYFQHQNDGSTIKVRRQKSRTTPQKLLIGGLIVGTAASLGFGAYFHVDSRDAAKQVSANDGLTGETWTPAQQATYDRAGDSGTIAIVGYVAGAAFLTGVIVAAWKTQPGEEELSIQPGRKAARPVIAPIAGGAVIGGAWSW